MDLENQIDVKVYYEDTDCLGIVYHANYLKFMERGRTEFFNDTGKPILHWNQEGFNFAVFEMKTKFLRAARLGDICRVFTKLTDDGSSEYRKIMLQRIELEEKIIVEAEVDIICLDNEYKLRAFPPGLFD